MLKKSSAKVIETRYIVIEAQYLGALTSNEMDVLEKLLKKLQRNMEKSGRNTNIGYIVTPMDAPEATAIMRAIERGPEKEDRAEEFYLSDPISI